MHKRQRGKPVTAASQSQRLQQQVQATTTSLLGSSPGGGSEVRRGCKEKKSRSLCGREDHKHVVRLPPGALATLETIYKRKPFYGWDLMTWKRLGLACPG